MRPEGKRGGSIKVANVVLDGRFGGPQNRILQVGERLKGLGVETIAIIPKVDSETFYEKLLQRNVSVRRLSLHRLKRSMWGNLFMLLFFLPELAALVRCLRREQVEIVHCNTAWQVKGVLAGKIAGCKVVLHLNSTWVPWWMRACFSFLAPFCDAFIVSGYRVKDLFFVGLNERHQKKPLADIQPPVDAKRLDPGKHEADPRLVHADGVRITTVGNVNPEKGLEYFVEMARLLTQRHAGLFFFIVGELPTTQKRYERRLRRLITQYQLNNVAFYGPTDDVASVLKATDIFVCSSVTESGPMSVWEAMAMEKAIVSTDVGAVSTYIRDGENGFVVAVKDVQGLSDRVSVLTEDKELRFRLGRRARITAEENLDVGLCAEKHWRFYHQVLAGEPVAVES